MSEKKRDYSNTIFYTICCNDPTVKELYIGHTTNFVQRQTAHKQNCANAKIGICKLYKVIRDNGGWNNWKMQIIAFHDCDDFFSAKKHEQYYFEEYKATLNSIEPLPKTKPKYIKNLNINNQTDTQMCIEKMIQERNFMCNICDFNCRKLSEYNRHLETKKHKKHSTTKHNIIISDDKSKNTTATYKCTCGKIYNHSSGLSRHKRICKPTNNIIVKQDVVENPDNNSKESIILALIAQNKELMNLLTSQQHEHSNALQEQSKVNIEQSKTIQELVHKIDNVSTIEREP
jgi:hypothetical protein